MASGKGKERGRERERRAKDPMKSVRGSFAEVRHDRIGGEKRSRVLSRKVRWGRMALNRSSSCERLFIS